MQQHGKAKKKPLPVRRLNLTIDEIGAKGDGLSVSNGEQIFVPYTAPGDQIIASVEGQKGKLIELLQLGPDRRSPPCPIFSRCGGCALQHVTPEYYQVWKRDQVTAPLAQVGLFEARLEQTVLIDPASRRRAQFYLARTGGKVSLGFYERRSRNLIDVSSCLVLHPDLNEKLAALKNVAAVAPVHWRSFSIAVTLCKNGLDLNFVSKQELDDPEPIDFLTLTAAMKRAGVVRAAINGDVIAAYSTPFVTFDGVPVELPPGSFLQASQAGQEALIALVKRGADSARKIVDLFAGSGTFALPLARHASVTAYDSDEGAIDALDHAARTAQANGSKPIMAEKRNLFERPLTASELDHFDLIVIDPPRAGAIQQMREIATCKVQRVLSVSCNPKTFARDAKILCEGGYQLQQVTPVDQFAYSPHIELVGTFVRA